MKSFACFAVLFSSCFAPVAAQVCDRAKFGSFLRSEVSNCLDALEKIPYAQVPDPEVFLLRLFVEPQFLSPPFSPVKNVLGGTTIVQLPKFWRSSQC